MPSSFTFISHHGLGCRLWAPACDSHVSLTVDSSSLIRTKCFDLLWIQLKIWIKIIHGSTLSSVERHHLRKTPASGVKLVVMHITLSVIIWFIISNNSWMSHTNHFSSGSPPTKGMTTTSKEVANEEDSDALTQEDLLHTMIAFAVHVCSFWYMLILGGWNLLSANWIAIQDTVNYNQNEMSVLLAYILDG